METVQPVTEEAVADGITYGTKGLFVDGIGLCVPPRDSHHDQNLIITNSFLDPTSDESFPNSQLNTLSLGMNCSDIITAESCQYDTNIGPHYPRQ
jgi:hypothetical protein